MKNILNVSKISLKPIFMSLAILFTAGVSFPNHFEKVVSASLPSDYLIEEEEEVSSDKDNNPICRTYRGFNDPNFIKNYCRNDISEEEEEEAAEEEEANEISVCPLDKIFIANCGEVTRENIKVEDPRSEYEIEIEEEEEDMGDSSEVFIPENNNDEQAKKAWKEFHNTLFGDRKSKINDLCPSIFSKCNLI